MTEVAAWSPAVGLTTLKMVLAGEREILKADQQKAASCRIKKESLYFLILDLWL